MEADVWGEKRFSFCWRMVWPRRTIFSTSVFEVMMETRVLISVFVSVANWLRTGWGFTCWFFKWLCKSSVIFNLTGQLVRYLRSHLALLHLIRLSPPSPLEEGTAQWELQKAVFSHRSVHRSLLASGWQNNQSFYNSISHLLLTSWEVCCLPVCS